MLGLIGKYATLKTNQFAVVPGPNPYRVNLQPWDYVIEVPIESKFPDGIKITPAASQSDFEKILKVIPEMSKLIGQLSPEQERVNLASLKKSCAWYRAELEKQNTAPQQKNVFPTPEKK